MIYAIGANKGGSGKTTTAAALLQAAAAREQHALAVDLDPQTNLSYICGADNNKAGAADLLDGAPAADLIQTTAQNIDVIAGSADLQTETTTHGSARRLYKALQPLKKEYDIIAIDTPATAGELLYNALQAADRLIIPLYPDVFNIRSLELTTTAAELIQRTNQRLKIAGVILTQYDARPTINRQLKDMLTNVAAEKGIPVIGTVRKSVVVPEAEALQRSLFEYAPKSKPAADYMQIFERLEV